MIASAPCVRPTQRVVTLLREAVALKIDHLRFQINITRRRIAHWESRFGLEPGELLEALRTRTLPISDQEAQTWYQDLRRLHDLQQDYQRLVDVFADGRAGSLA